MRDLSEKEFAEFMKEEGIAPSKFREPVDKPYYDVGCGLNVCVDTGSRYDDARELVNQKYSAIASQKFLKWHQKTM